MASYGSLKEARRAHGMTDQVLLKVSQQPAIYWLVDVTKARRLRPSRTWDYWYALGRADGDETMLSHSATLGWFVDGSKA